MTTNNQRSCCEGQKRIAQARDAATEKRKSGPSPPDAKQAAKQPSAPTAESEAIGKRMWEQFADVVEKIAWEAADEIQHRLNNKELTPHLLKEIIGANYAHFIAEVSAPLVEAIDVAIALLDQCKDISARKVLNAALTSTEISRVKEGVVRVTKLGRNKKQ